MKMIPNGMRDCTSLSRSQIPQTIFIHILIIIKILGGSPTQQQRYGTATAAIQYSSEIFQTSTTGGGGDCTTNNTKVAAPAGSTGLVVSKVSTSVTATQLAQPRDALNSTTCKVPVTTPAHVPSSTSAPDIVNTLGG